MGGTRIAMADKEPKRPPRKQKPFRKVKKEVKQLKKQLKVVKRRERRFDRGPKTDDLFKLSIVIGPVYGNSTNQELLRTHHIQLNPLLVKSANGPLSTPLSVRAAQFLLYKIDKCHIKLTSLVGTANISGSMVYVSLDSDGTSVKPTTVSDLLATPHTKTHVGSSNTWRLNTRYLQGPNKGWFYVNTSDKAVQSLGPSLDVWVYMQTKNLLTTTSNVSDYNGPLFLLELSATYRFSNYSPQPELSMLPTHSGEVAANLKKETDGSLVLSLKGDVAVLVDQYLLNEKSLAMRSNSSLLSDVIWTAAGAVVPVLSAAAGPWGWLIAGGYWILRRVFGKENATDEASFYVYSSISDATNDMRCKTTSPVSGSEVTTNIRLQALNVQNINSSSDNGFASSASVVPFPLTTNQRKPMVFPLQRKDKPVYYVTCSGLDFSLLYSETSGELSQAGIKLISGNLSAYCGTVITANPSQAQSSLVYYAKIEPTTDSNDLLFLRTDGVLLADGYSLLSAFVEGKDPVEYGFSLIQSSAIQLNSSQQPCPVVGSAYVMPLSFFYNTSAVIPVGASAASGPVDSTNAMTPLLLYDPAKPSFHLLFFFVVTKGMQWAFNVNSLSLPNAYFEMGTSMQTIQPFGTPFSQVQLDTPVSEVDDDFWFFVGDYDQRPTFSFYGSSSSSDSSSSDSDSE
uniref:Capsid n=1 Tax=Avastrovirus 3 TaxID=1239439 RepID=K7T505_9VIRU|nr:capsid [Avastrovirus 3]